MSAKSNLILNFGGGNQEKMKKEINKTNVKILGSIIKMNRICQNMSQKALSEGICVSSYLSRIENAEIIPSEQVISDLFDALAIHYNDSEGFIQSGKALFQRFLDELNFNEFSNSRLIFEQISADSEKYMHSPLIIDYYIVQLAFYCTRKEREIFEETRHLLESVEQLMNAEQKFKYYLYWGIDTAKVAKDYPAVLEILDKASTYGDNGHLYYWMGFAYLSLRKDLSALIQFQKALSTYLDEANLLSIIGSYEMLGLTFYASDDYEGGKPYFEKGLKLANKLGSSSHESTFRDNLLWGAFRLGQLNPEDSFNRDWESESECVTERSIPNQLTHLLQAIEQSNTMFVSTLKPLKKERFVELMIKHLDKLDWQGHMIDDEKLLLKLIQMSKGLNYELEKYYSKMYQSFLIQHRRYKEALEIQNV